MAHSSAGLMTLGYLHFEIAERAELRTRSGQRPAQGRRARPVHASNDKSILGRASLQIFQCTADTREAGTLSNHYTIIAIALFITIHYSLFNIDYWLVRNNGALAFALAMIVHQTIPTHLALFNTTQYRSATPDSTRYLTTIKNTS